MAPQVHLVVCTPCYGGLVGQRYMLSTTSLLLAGFRAGFNVSLELLGDSLVTRARNRLVAKFLDRPEATHLLFVDADIGFDPADVLRMIDFGGDVVAGTYPLKTVEWSDAAIARVNAGEPPDSAPLRYVGLAEAGAAGTEGFIPAVYAGTGFMLIRRAVLLRLMAAHPELHFAAAHDSPEDNPSPHQAALFDASIDPVTRHYLSEDYTFCARWRALGGRLWLDTRARLIHTGAHAFAGNPALRYAV